MTALVIGSTGRASELADRAHQRFDLARLALALSAYHSEKSAYPNKLADLVPAYLKSTPQDIFTSAPLKFSSTRDSYLLYSLGPNQTDEKGVPDKSESRGDLVVEIKNPP